MASFREPKILLANSRFTTATRGEFLSSCHDNVLPANKLVRAASKYSGDMLYVMASAAAFAGLRSVVFSVKTFELYVPQYCGSRSTDPTDLTPGLVCKASIMRFCIAGT